MKKAYICAIWAFCVLILLAGCRSEAIEDRVGVDAPMTLSTRVAQPTLSDGAIPLESTESTAIKPEAILAVAADWGSRARAAIETLNADGTSFQWYLQLNANPAEALTSGAVQVALVAGDEGQIVWEEPLALAVPFTVEWDEVTWEEAQNIYAVGHPDVSVIEWTQLKPIQRALRIDGMMPDHFDYPLRATWSLVGAPGFEGAIGELAPILRATVAPDKAFRLAAVGDVMLDRSLGQALSRGDITGPFAAVNEVLRGADLTIGNLESALGSGDVGQAESKGYVFRAPPQAAEALALGGFDVMSLANNHALDFGSEALLDGMSQLQQQGIDTIGAGRNAQTAHSPLLRQVVGNRLALLAYVNVRPEVGGFDTESWAAIDEVPGVAWATPEQIRADVAAAQTQSDLVIVSLHSGTEFQAAPSATQIELARAAVDAGARLVIGHHAHVLQGIEFYNEGVIVYGLGNFAFDNGDVPETAIINVWLGPDGVRQLEIVPVIIGYAGQPRLATEVEAASIRRHVYALTRLLNDST